MARPPKETETIHTAPERTSDKDVKEFELEVNPIQPGIQGAEVVKSTLTTGGIVALFSMITLITFTTALQVQIMYSTLPYVYSDFGAHSLIPTTDIVSSIIAAVFRLPLSKVLNLWGRAQGFALMLTIFTIGVTMMAACQNVVTYCAASVFFWTGFDGMFYVLYVILADNFSLRNRGFMFGLYNAPYLVTTWVGSPIASRFLSGPGWRWSFGTFAIAAPIAGLPLIVLLLWNYRKARLRSVISEPREDRTTWEGVKYYWVEFDFIGLILLAGGFSLLLLPFSLYTKQESGWASPMIICMMVFGVFCLLLFALWEKYWAAKSFLPWELIKDRTIIGGSIASANTYLVYYVWYSFFSSSLQVVQGLDITLAGYVVNIHSVGWVLAGIVAGALIRTTSHYKWIALYVGSPLQILATGLMYHFSGTKSPTGLIVMAQVFLSLADGLIYLTSEVAVLAVIEHEHIAVVLAVYNMVTSIFQAVGATISAAIWTKVFPSYLAQNLPENAQSQLEDIYSSIYSQLSFEKGSAERLAIEQSYSQAMQKLFTAALCLTVVGLVATIFWRDVDVKEKDEEDKQSAKELQDQDQDKDDSK